MSRNSPIGRLVDQLPGKHWTISEASVATGIPVTTLRVWYRNGTTRAPSNFVHFGQLKVYLYSEDDIKELTALRSTTIPKIQKRIAEDEVRTAS
jgi:DNA-binding transcriptional MerR regulator